MDSGSLDPPADHDGVSRLVTEVLATIKRYIRMTPIPSCWQRTMVDPRPFDPTDRAFLEEMLFRRSSGTLPGAAGLADFERARFEAPGRLGRSEDRGVVAESSDKNWRGVVSPVDARAPLLWVRKCRDS
jgi:hypothetical protein